MIGKPLYFDFSGTPPDPEWIVEGLLERGTLTLLAGAPGVAKSYISQSLTVAVIQGRPWLGRPTQGKRVIYVDEENHSREVHTRMFALGMGNADRDKLRYYCRQGVRIGEDQTLDELHREISTFEPDLLFVDTTASAIAIESVNDNAQVSAVMRGLRGLCGTGAAVVISHHENKQGKEKRNARTAFMGAQQWQGQADQHLALGTEMGEPEESNLPDGKRRRRFVMTLEAPKNRGGRRLAQKLELVSDHDSEGRPLPGRTRVRAFQR